MQPLIHLRAAHPTGDPTNRSVFAQKPQVLSSTPSHCIAHNDLQSLRARQPACVPDGTIARCRRRPNAGLGANFEPLAQRPGLNRLRLALLRLLVFR